VGILLDFKGRALRQQLTTPSRPHTVRAETLDPLSPVLSSLAATPLLGSRQYDKAIEQLRKVQELDPNLPLPRMFLQQAYEGKGDFAGAINEWQQVALGFGEKSEIVSARVEKLRRGFTEKGERSYWQTQLEFLKADSKQSPADSYALALLYAHLGDQNRTFQCLEKGFSRTLTRFDSVACNRTGIRFYSH
jgi:tetratricopeptide (TPR) repeat protein